MSWSVPLGYDVRDRKLVVNQTEAATVRRAVNSATDHDLQSDRAEPLSWLIGCAKLGRRREDLPCLPIDTTYLCQPCP